MSSSISVWANEFPLDEGSEDRRQVWAMAITAPYHHMHRASSAWRRPPRCPAGDRRSGADVETSRAEAASADRAGLAMIAMMFALHWSHQPPHDAGSIVNARTSSPRRFRGEAEAANVPPAGAAGNAPAMERLRN